MVKDASVPIGHGKIQQIAEMQTLQISVHGVFSDADQQNCPGVIQNIQTLQHQKVIGIGNHSAVSGIDHPETGVPLQ